jgi:tartrate dehydratase beta subunit/fumarate hydratase class I family protein
MGEFRLRVPQDNDRISEVRADDVLYVSGDIVVA